MQNFFVGIAKKINNIFVVNSYKISIDPYLNEKLCWASQSFVDSTKYFSGCYETESAHRQTDVIQAFQFFWKFLEIEDINFIFHCLQKRNHIKINLNGRNKKGVLLPLMAVLI